MQPTTTIKVVLADDHAIVRKTLAAYLEKEPDIKVVAEVDNTETLVAVVVQLTPHLLLLDANMPGPSTVEITDTLQTRCPTVRVLVLSAYKKQQQVIDLVTAGANGYILKEDKPSDLLQAIRAVAQGEEWFSPKITRVLVNSVRENDLKEKLELTEREKDVLRLMITGASNKEIADKLFIAHNTVKNHVRHIYGKLDVDSRVDAILFALQHHLVEKEL